MKKVIALLLSAGVICTFGACAKTSPAAGTTAQAAAQTGAASQTAAVKEDEPSLEIIFADESSEKQTRYGYVKKFAELVEQKTDGKITVDVNINGILGTARESLEAMQEGGVVDMTITVEPLSYWLDEVNVLSVPFLFRDEEHVDAFETSAVGQELRDLILQKAHVRALGYMATEPRVITSNKLLRNLADLKGLKIRVPETATGPLAFEAMGCKVTTMPFSEVFSALQQGVIDSQENPIAWMRNFSFYEVQSHVLMSNHQITVPYLLISEKTFQKLSENQRQMLYDAAEEARLYEKELRKQETKEVMDLLNEKGIVITELSDADRQDIIDAAETAYPKYDAVVQEWIKKIQAI